MIPKHETSADCVAYLRALANYFENLARTFKSPEDEWPWGDILPLRAAANKLEDLNFRMEGLEK
jgi:hypothetical protein